MDAAMYRAAEQRFWGSYGLVPSERFVHLASMRTRVRVLEVGEGDPVLFLHGGPNAGSGWAPLVAHLSGFRYLVVDRPGTGLSDGWMPDAELTMIPDAGHLPWLDDPERIAAQTAAFLDASGDRRAAAPERGVVAGPVASAGGSA